MLSLPLGIAFKGGQGNIFWNIRKSQIRNFLGFLRYRKSATCLQSANRKSAIFMVNTQIANSQISNQNTAQP
jgi:hypothetical protein